VKALAAAGLAIEGERREEKRREDGRMKELNRLSPYVSSLMLSIYRILLYPDMP
jgi:hypothetical protein